ncbi:MAG: DUF2244 domain-containing protein [Pararhodobacter sp.]|nr:DUF2244 domain-containing protein [Pararhodobacter sp.]
MPYALTASDSAWSLRLWPHNALKPRGFAGVIGLCAGVLALPLLAMLGQPVLWGLLPFAGLALWGLWYAIQRNWQDRSVVEEMHLSRRAIHLRRLNPRAPVQEWRADPAWVTLTLVARGGPVEHYLTLTGGGREVELGAFLMPDERIALHDELQELLVRLKGYA